MPRHRFVDTADRIEQAAVQLFVEKGVAETTIKDIARAVGLSEGALYRHFDSKDELVWKAFERHYVAFAATLRQLAESEPTARGKIAAMIRGFCRAHDENPTLFKFLLFVQHGQLAKLEPGHTDAGRGDARRARARDRVARDSHAAARPGDRAGVRRRAAAGHVCGLRKASSTSARCASVSSPHRGRP